MNTSLSIIDKGLEQKNAVMKRTVRDIDFGGKAALVRCDFNVPLDKECRITDDTRIVGALPTINYLIGQGAKVILMSHLGRPDGEAKLEFSLAPVAADLSEKLGIPVYFESVPEVVNEDIRVKAASMAPGGVMLLENTRFRKEEDTKEISAQAPFAKELASLGDIFVNDAFGTAHRHHASTAGVADYLPAVMGFLMEKELKYLGEALENPKRPFVAIMGGAKVADKIPVIKNLMKKADTILIGGGMAFTFLKAMGCGIGKSILDNDGIEFAGSLLEIAEGSGVKIILPKDILAAEAFDNEAHSEVFETSSAEGIPDGFAGLDIGPVTIGVFAGEIAKAGSILWNGPMGVFEMPGFAGGTRSVSEAIVKATENGAISIIGGGDSAAAVTQFGHADKMTHVSTGGGASLEFIEGRPLPGVEALS